MAQLKAVGDAQADRHIRLRGEHIYTYTIQESELTTLRDHFFNRAQGTEGRTEARTSNKRPAPIATTDQGGPSRPRDSATNSEPAHKKQATEFSDICAELAAFF